MELIATAVTVGLLGFFGYLAFQAYWHGKTDSLNSELLD